ncbi:MAG: TIGR03118 family protein, partial [Stenotrophobium sp.]
IIYNGTSDFVAGSGATAAPGQFIYSGEGGTIAAWAPTVSLNMATTVHDDGAGGAVYKGLALANNGSGNFLYATDIHNAKIDVFDTHFNKVAMAGGFSDPNIPAGYAPFGIAAIQNQLYVTYAKQDAAKHDEVFGVGFGYVDIFDANGNLIKRFASQGLLNAPWGIAVAPANFGILIGNFGDGLLNIFNPTSGQFIGTATQANGQPLVIPGLWGLVYGNGQSNQPSNALFYTAGPNNQMDGIFGRIDAVTTTTTTPGSGGMPCTGYGC